MKTNLKLLILIAVALALAACDSQTKRMEQAQALYKEGVQLREQRRSEEAAEKFLHGLALVQRSNKINLDNPKKHGQNREALQKPLDKRFFCIFLRQRKGHALRHCEERSSLDMKLSYLDCFVVPPRNDAKRTKSLSKTVES